MHGIELTQIKAQPRCAMESADMKNIIKYLHPISTACLTMAVALVCLAGPVLSQEFKWEGDLRKQLKDEHQCELNYLTGAGTIEIIGKQTVVARAHCRDKRAFDVRRPDGERRFEVKSCAQVAC